MTVSYTHIANSSSPTGSVSKMVHSDGTIVEAPSVILNEAGDIDEKKSEMHLATCYEFRILTETQGAHFSSIDSSNVIDKTYMNGVQIRTDYSVGSTKGQELVEELKESWPDKVPSYDNNSMNLVAKYTATRPPYDTNPSISFYSWDPASSDLLESFDANYSEYVEWYGLKFDTVTQDVLLKAVIPATEMDRVDSDAYHKILDLLPTNNFTFFARVHDKDGNVNENVDVYFQSIPNTVKEWCEDKGHELPFDFDDSSITDKLFIWGCVYNKVSGEITHVKGYTREQGS